MNRSLLLFPLLFACAPETGVIDIGDDVEDPDAFSEYDGATLRIVSPASGSFLAIEQAHGFEVALIGADGAPLAFEDVNWTTNVSQDWTRTGLAFEESEIPVGLHDITAEVTLPNGDRLAHTVGGVLVQSMYAGTYVGLFSADVTYDAYTVTCSGAATIVVDPYGEVATGGATCILALMGYEMEADYTFDLENDEGELSGTANADIGGFFEFPFEADGLLDPEANTLDIAFAGDLGGMALIDAEVGTERISLDAGL